MTEFDIGVKFTINEYNDAYNWVKAQEKEYYTIQEIEMLDGDRMFEIVDITPSEEEFFAMRKEGFLKQFFKIGDYGYFRKQPKGYGSAVESLNTAFNVVTIMQKLPADTLTFYTEPDFTDEKQCTEEWLIANSFKNVEMTTEEFAQFYAQFMTAWNNQEHK